MLNRRPIFLNCFSRGGSNIFWNLFLSHPDACSPIEETLVIFRTDWRRPTWPGIRLALLSGQPRFFDQWKLADRRGLGRAAARFLDGTLFRWKMRTVTDPEMRFKSASEVYTEEEVRRSRLVAKHNNGLTFLVSPLLDLYPDAIFFGLVRHPVPLYESHVRRGITDGPGKFADFYTRIAERMLDDAESRPCCHLVRFEDVLERPVDIAKHVYETADLEPERVTSLRFKAKAHYRADGSYGSALEERRHHWLPLSEVGTFLEPDVNRVQTGRVGKTEAAEVMARTAAVRERLGYG